MGREPAVYRPMTEAERKLARALAGCRFPIASFDKRFGRTMGALADAPEPKITEKQAALLRVKAHRYRRQIPAEVLGQFSFAEAASG